MSALIKAMELLSKGFRCRLDILGNGPLLESLKAEAFKSGNIHFHGWLSIEQVKDFLANADIFILPSFSEGLSIAALQAMGQGCALVASDIPMNKDILDEGVNGFFCGHSPESISATIMKCIPNLDRLKAGSVAKVLSFSWEAIGERYFDCFERAYGNKKKEDFPGQTH